MPGAKKYRFRSGDMDAHLERASRVQEAVEEYNRLSVARSYLIHRNQNAPEISIQFKDGGEGCSVAASAMRGILIGGAIPGSWLAGGRDSVVNILSDRMMELQSFVIDQNGGELVYAAIAEEEETDA